MGTESLGARAKKLVNEITNNDKLTINDNLFQRLVNEDNDIVNKGSERTFRYSLIVNNSKRKNKGYTASQAQYRATYLANKLNDQTSFQFYLKCAWNLNDAYLDWLLERALKAKSPSHYFSRAARKAMSS